MMKRIVYILFLFLFLVTGTSFAQQHSSYTQYTLNRFALNPAVAGLRPCTITTMGQRRQWSGFEGAPVLNFASFHTRLKKDVKFLKNFHGIGAYVSNDRTGFTTYSKIKFAYAYHLKLWTNYHLSVGIYAGIHQEGISKGNIQIPNGPQNDPVFQNAKYKTLIYPEVSPGGFIYNKNSYLGLSFLQVYPSRKGKIGTKDNKLSGHYFLMGGYRLRGQTLHYIPSILINFAPLISPTVDFTLTIDYKQKISIALGSKYLNSAYTTLQMKLGRKVSLGYSYEYALNEIAKVAPSSHEIIVQFSTCALDPRKQQSVCPAYQ